MEKVKNIIIGFGKAGKTLAQDLSKRGESTILIEKDPKMYGGTCINVACIPSKKLATLAQRKPENIDNATYYSTAIQEKNTLINELNQANYNLIEGQENVQIIDGEASFVDENVVKVSFDNGDEEKYEAERIFINTGSVPNIPPIKGLRIDARKIHTSRTLMDDEEFPEKLTIIGDGPIGLEFASIYSQFGSEVTILSNQSETNFLNMFDRDVAESVLNALKNMGVNFIFDANTNEVDSTLHDSVNVMYEKNNQVTELTANKVLVATGRRPNVEQLNLDAADVLLAENGSVQINKRLQTNKPHIFALGDVNGGPQQTYLSLDDYRIVRSHLFEDGSYDLSDRAFIPNTTFINPPLSSVGLSENAARESGFEVKVATIPVESIPKAKILGNTVGIYKAIVDAESDHILGAVLFGEESHEVINIIATAMKGEMPFHLLANQVFTHPTMAESLNDLFGKIQ